MTLSLLDKTYTGLVVVDVQVKLMAVMGQRDKVINNLKKLLYLSGLFNIPVILTEQYPGMLGSTLSEIKEALQAYDPIKKMDFDCCAVEPFNDLVKSKDLKNIILTGVESHICIFQTCLHLLKKGYKVHVPQDAVDSRTEENRLVGIELMKKAGAIISSTETIIFQILKRAGTQEFKEMLKMVK